MKVQRAVRKYVGCACDFGPYGSGCLCGVVALYKERAALVAAAKALLANFRNLGQGSILPELDAFASAAIRQAEEPYTE